MISFPSRFLKTEDAVGRSASSPRASRCYMLCHKARGSLSAMSGEIVVSELRIIFGNYIITIN